MPRQRSISLKKSPRNSQRGGGTSRTMWYPSTMSDHIPFAMIPLPWSQLLDKRQAFDLKTADLWLTRSILGFSTQILFSEGGFYWMVG